MPEVTPEEIQERERGAELMEAVLNDLEEARRIVERDPGALEAHVYGDETAVFFWAVENELEGVRRFLELGANPNPRDSLGNSPLLDICFLSTLNLEMFRLLVEFGADPTLVNHAEETAVHRLAANDFRDGFMLLGDIPVTILSEALHIAIEKGHQEFAELLLQRGADPNQRNYLGWTGLMAVDEPEFAALLLRHGARMDELTESEETALHLAARFQHRELAQYYIQIGLDPEALDGHGNRPRDYLPGLR
jgi:ankyrin repeat protein